MRVHELAKELECQSKDLIVEIQALGEAVKNHMSQVDEKIAESLRKKRKSKAPAVEPKTQPKKETAVLVPAAKKVKEAKKTEAVPEKISKPSPVLPAKSPEPSAPVVAAKPVSAPVQAAQPAPVPQPAAKSAKPIRFPIMVGSLAAELNIRIPELIKTLMGMGIFANVNQLLNEEIGIKLGHKLGILIEKIEDETEKIISEIDTAEEKKLLKPRPPVVTMMGHVDHGKTSLLDAIRKTKVAATEKGFITQHIGAYGVDIPGRGHVTFLDTPGHEAFTAMRARGANVTDVVVLVVAADDGIMPQTIEAAAHAREAGCPIVVAINKSDLPQANPQKVLTGLQRMDLVPEEWGGKTICVKVSAKTGQGIEQLLELLLLEAEVLELKANPDRKATGTVIEGHLSKGSGPVATVIVQKGTLRVGDILVCGASMGRVKSLRNDRGKTIKDVGPSYAAEVSGLNGVPEAGEHFLVVEDEKTARKITAGGAQKHLSLEGLYERISKGNFKELKLILKADVQGSEEALASSLERLSNDQCRVRVIHGSVGGINESDIMLAAASDAIIIGFHVKADPKAEEIAEKEGVDLRFYNIIYEVVEDVRKALEGLLEPTFREISEGRIQIRKVFKISRYGNVGGGFVIKGKVTRSNRVRVLRDNIVVFEGKLSSLKRFKDDVREVAQGYECGVTVEGFDDLREEDVLESFRVEKVATKLTAPSAQS